ncbi:alpha/beta hydrolase [Fictibacillus sp. KIGAM418]|uniref:Alpha/beta hydrolase n=1 Tax=Fictibacillus marinisediminis TaxID=2878389 RepID=A0A9X1XCQ1_9BACL|nr:MULTISPECIES: alpha/beta hydrolase [Fictibacillus]MCK6257390.1 alpha/beta hydrolase [Fictibacillus marinisediminis]MED2974369.1 alpha/beta hydrolase [Fictibacillus sp. B-59209]
MPFFENKEGVQLFYQEWGTGNPVVFVSGWSLSSRMWDYQRIFLSNQGLRCIAYDRRGHGRSDEPGKGYDFDTLADDLAALIEYLNLRNVTLVCHSMGGGEVIRYLTRHGSDRIDRAVLIAAIVPFLMKTEDNPNGIPKEVADRVRETWKRDFPTWLIENELPYLDSPKTTAMGEWTRWDMLQTSLKAVIECNKQIIETDFREEMRSINVRTLIIHGDKDRSIPVEISGQKSAMLLSKSKFTLYNDAPHGLYITHSDRINKDILTFINDIQI